jgi:purine-binding chemotaxis protein CheW
VASLDLLAIRLGGEPYALHLAAVSGLFAGKKFTRLPQAAPEFLGIAGFRGSVVPVYDLRVLLGCVGGEAPRWLVVVAGSPVALAFDGFDGHLRLPQDGIARQERSEAAPAHVRELARVAGLPRPIVDVASILVAIQQRARQDVAAQARE